ncbi:MAG: DUF4252 domain-containing protein [Saprospiraceae bacterium]|nr:DUF4252 domain-containing protein [Saprospiraceae bacterium]
MLRIIILLLFVGLGTPSSWAQETDKLDKFFNKYNGQEDFTSIYISKYMFGMIAKLDKEAANADAEMEKVKGMLEGLEGMQLLISEKNGIQLYKEVNDILTGSEYNVLMQIQSEGEKIKFITREGEEGIERLTLIIGSDEFLMLNINGNIDLEKLSELSDYIEIDGFEHLDKIDLPEKKNEPNHKRAKND